MKAVQASRQLGQTGQTLFATSFGLSVLIHGLAIGWMLSGGGASRSLLSDVSAFHTVSLVDAPGPSLSEPQAIAEPAAVPEAMGAVTVRNVVPEALVPPPQAKQAAEVPEASVEPPAPAAKPTPVEEPERPSVSVVETQVEKPVPSKASVKKPTPTKTANRRPTPAAPKVDAVQAKAAPAAKTAVKPKSASRNSPQAAARARDAIANIRRAQARVQGTNAIQSQGGVTAGMQEVLMRTYDSRVRASIISAWSLPMMRNTAEALQAVALVTIDREGRVLRYQLIESSGSQPFDASLERAVWTASPLPHLPETFPEETREFKLRFTPPSS